MLMGTPKHGTICILRAIYPGPQWADTFWGHSFSPGLPAIMWVLGASMAPEAPVACQAATRPEPVSGEGCLKWDVHTVLGGPGHVEWGGGPRHGVSRRAWGVGS